MMKQLAVAATLLCVPMLALAQKSTPADVAAKISGTWKVNRDLSPSVGRGRGRGGLAAAPAPRLVLASFQRGGADTGTQQDLTPEQLAARTAIRSLQQIPETLKIVATADQVTFTDARGVASFPINNKAVKTDVAGTKIDVKSKWDKETLRQEFNAYQQKLTRTWSVDENGHLVLALLIESMNMNANTGMPNWTQQTAAAMFDKQQ